MSLITALSSLKPLKGMTITEVDGAVTIWHSAAIDVFSPIEATAKAHGYQVVRRGRDLERRTEQFYVRLERRQLR